MPPGGPPGGPSNRPAGPPAAKNRSRSSRSIARVRFATERNFLSDLFVPRYRTARYGARAERRGCLSHSVERRWRCARILGAPGGAARSAAALRGSFANRAAVREKKVNGTMLHAAFSDRSRYHLNDEAVSKSQKSTFSTNGEKKNGFLVPPSRSAPRRAFLGTDVHARARHLRVEGWKRPRRATRARPPRRRGKTTPRASPGRCTTPRPTRTRRETTRMKSPCVIFTSPLAAP